MWDIRSFSRLQSLTLTFTRYYSRYRGTRLVSIWLDQGFKSYVMYCTVLYCTVLYCTVPYCTLLYCTVLYRTVLYYTHCCIVVRRNCFWAGQYIGNHSRNDYFGFITANFLEFHSRGDRGGWGEKLEYLPTSKQTIKQILNSKTEAHSNPLWIVGERANRRRNQGLRTTALALPVWLGSTVLIWYNIKGSL